MIEHDDDIEAAKTPTLLRVAGGFGLFAGTIVVLTAVQALSGFILLGIYAIAPYPLLIVGGFLAFAGATLMRARSSAALMQITAAVMSLVCSGVWLLLSLRGGLVSLFGLFGPLLCAGSLGLAIASLEACDRVNVARKRLAQKGLDLGI